MRCQNAPTKSVKSVPFWEARRGAANPESSRRGGGSRNRTTDRSARAGRAGNSTSTSTCEGEGAAATQANSGRDQGFIIIIVLLRREEGGGGGSSGSSSSGGSRGADGSGRRLYEWSAPSLHHE